MAIVISLCIKTIVLTNSKNVCNLCPSFLAVDSMKTNRKTPDHYIHTSLSGSSDSYCSLEPKQRYHNETGYTASET